MKRNRKYFDITNNTGSSDVAAAVIENNTANTNNSILILRWFVLKHIFSCLLAITGFLIFLSIYFLSIYGESNLFTSVKIDNTHGSSRIFNPKIQSNKASKIGQEFWSSEDYNDETLSSKKDKQLSIDEEENGAWWHWFLIQPKENEKHFSNNDSQLILNQYRLLNEQVSHPMHKLNHFTNVI